METSLLRASVSFVSENAARYFETGHVPRRKHRTTTAGVFAFEDQDGLAFVLHMSSPDKFWLGLFDVVGKSELAQDARFNNRKGRIENYDVFFEQLQPIFRAGAGMTGCAVCWKKMFPPRRSTRLMRFSPTHKSRLRLSSRSRAPKMGKMKLVGNAVYEPYATDHLPGAAHARRAYGGNPYCPRL